MPPKSTSYRQRVNQPVWRFAMRPTMASSSDATAATKPSPAAAASAATVSKAAASRGNPASAA